MLIDCRRIAEGINASTEELRKQVSYANPKLIVVHGDDEGSRIYRTMIARDCKRFGINLVDIHVDHTDLTPMDWNLFIGSRAYEPTLVQFPLGSERWTREEVECNLSVVADMDGISEAHAVKLYMGRPKPGCNTCTASAVIDVVQELARIRTGESGLYGIDGSHVVVIGRSNTVGKPVAMSMMYMNATVSICHSKTPKSVMEVLCASASIVINAGPSEPPVGYNALDGVELLIDISEAYDPVEAAKHVKYFVGKGNNIGPITRAVLMNRVVRHYLGSDVLDISNET